jgi:hypothetical protein
MHPLSVWHRADAVRPGRDTLVAAQQQHPSRLRAVWAWFWMRQQQQQRSNDGGADVEAAAAVQATAAANVAFLRSDEMVRVRRETLRLSGALGDGHECQYIHLHADGGSGALCLLGVAPSTWPNVVAIYMKPFETGYVVLMPTTTTTLDDDAAILALARTEHDALAPGTRGAPTTLATLRRKLHRIRAVHGLGAALRWRAAYRRAFAGLFGINTQIAGTLELLLAPYTREDDAPL